MELLRVCLVEIHRLHLVDSWDLRIARSFELKSQLPLALRRRPDPKGDVSNMIGSIQAENDARAAKLSWSATAHGRSGRINTRSGDTVTTDAYSAEMAAIKLQVRNRDTG